MKSFLKPVDIRPGALARDVEFIADCGVAPCHFALVRQVRAALPIAETCPIWVPFVTVVHELFKKS